MELPQRKNLRLETYDYSASGAYFVTVCTHDRRQILSSVSVGADALGGPLVILTNIGRIVEKYILSTDKIPHVRVDKYVIMPDHIHLILIINFENGPPRASAPTTAALPNAVSALKRLVNRELGENIWQRGYYEHVIRNNADYAETCAYIDGNPAQWLDKHSLS